MPRNRSRHLGRLVVACLLWPAASFAQGAMTNGENHTGAITIESRLGTTDAEWRVSALTRARRPDDMFRETWESTPRLCAGLRTAPASTSRCLSLRPPTSKRLRLAGRSLYPAWSPTRG